MRNSAGANNSICSVSTETSTRTRAVRSKAVRTGHCPRSIGSPVGSWRASLNMEAVLMTLGSLESQFWEC